MGHSHCISKTILRVQTKSRTGFRRPKTNFLSTSEPIGLKRKFPTAIGHRRWSCVKGQARGRFESRYESIFSPPYFDNSRWALPALPDYLKAAPTGYAVPDSYPIDSRGFLFTFAFFTAKHLGEGQFYLMTVKDKDGRNIDGAGSYRVTVPANAPVSQYWSATVYDRATHALIRDLPRSGRGSQSPGLQRNDDGSVDIYFGSDVLRGKEQNWVPARAGGEFEILFRFYGPTKPLFDKTWKLPDVDKLEPNAVGRALQ